MNKRAYGAMLDQIWDGAVDIIVSENPSLGVLVRNTTLNYDEQFDKIEIEFPYATSFSQRESRRIPPELIYFAIAKSAVKLLTNAENDRYTYTPEDPEISEKRWEF